ncbi:MAG: hypothetical protein AAFN65_12140, partial [Bacteroidota bacterium]
RKLFLVDDMVYYINFSNQIRAYSLVNNTNTLLIESPQINGMELVDNKVYFCTFSGIYSVERNDLSSFRSESDLSCSAIQANSDGNIYFTGWNEGELERQTQGIYLYSLINGELNRFTSFEVENSISTFLLLRNGSSFVLNRGNTDKIYYVNATGELIETYTESNSPLGIGNFQFKNWAVEDEDGVLFVFKNGAGYPKIFKFDLSTNSWENYISPQVLEEARESNQAKLREFIIPAYSNIALEDNELYIATTLSGCLGVQRITLNQNIPITLNEVEIIRDAAFDIGHCIQGIQIDQINSRKIIYSQSGLMVLEQCS